MFILKSLFSNLILRFVTIVLDIVCRALAGRLSSHVRVVYTSFYAVQIFRFDERCTYIYKREHYRRDYKYFSRLIFYTKAIFKCELYTHIFLGVIQYSAGEDVAAEKLTKNGYYQKYFILFC